MSGGGHNIGRTVILAGSQEGQEDEQEEESKEAQRHNATIHRISLRSRQGEKALDDGGGLRQAVGVFQGFVAQPEDVQVDLIASGQLVVGEGPPAAGGVGFGPGGRAFVAVGGVEAGDKVVQVGAGQGVLFECDGGVGAGVGA